MDLRHLRYFLAVAEAGNVTRAAEGLGIAQPPLSQQIRDLEADLGVQLFRRLPRGVALTAAGEAFAVEARLTLSAAERARAAAKQAARGETGRLSLSFTASAAFNPQVAATILRFRRQWPQVALSLTETTTAAAILAIAEGRLDAAFVRPGLSAWPGLQVRRLVDEPMVAVLAEDHPLARQPLLPLAQLAHEPIILFPRSVSPSLHDEITAAAMRAGAELQITQEAPQIVSTIALAAAGLGIAFAPASASRLALRGAAFRPIGGDTPVARLALAYRAGPTSPALRNLLSSLNPA